MKRDREKEAMRRRVIAEWRLMGEPRDTTKHETDLAAMLPAVIRQLGVGQRVTEEEISQHWEELVGTFIAGLSRPLSLKNGVLMVGVTQSAVKYTLERELKGDLLAKLKAQFGARKVTQLRFVAG